MTIEEYEALKKQNEALKMRMHEMEQDLKQTIGIFKSLLEEVDLRPSEGITKNNVIAALPKISIKVMTGGFKLDKFKNLIPLYNKYEYLFK